MFKLIQFKGWEVYSSTIDEYCVQFACLHELSTVANSVLCSMNNTTLMCSYKISKLHSIVAINYDFTVYISGHSSLAVTCIY